MTGYDSRPDTHEHIGAVRGLLLDACIELLGRSHRHDRSKLVEPELSIFNEFTPKLRDSTYGSDEYKQFLVQMGEGLKHHYAHNAHHPEHWKDGIHGMTLVDLLEMLVDWKAATMRHADGDLDRSITINRERFGYGDEIEGLLRLTARHFGWLSPECTCGWGPPVDLEKFPNGLLDGGHQPGCPKAVRAVRP